MGPGSGSATSFATPHFPTSDFVFVHVPALSCAVFRVRGTRSLRRERAGSEKYLLRAPRSSMHTPPTLTRHPRWCERERGSRHRALPALPRAASPRWSVTHRLLSGLTFGSIESSALRAARLSVTAFRLVFSPRRRLSPGRAFLSRLDLLSGSTRSSSSDLPRSGVGTRPRCLCRRCCSSRRV